MEFGVQLDAASQHVDELLPLMGAPAAEIGELACLDFHMQWDHVLAPSLGRMDLVYIHVGREVDALAAARQGQAPGRPAGRRRVEHSVEAEAETAGDPQQRVEGGGDLRVLDLR